MSKSKLSALTTFEEILQAMADYQERERFLNRARPVFLTAFYDEIDESLFKREVFVATTLAAESNTRAFAIVAYNIAKNGKTFKHILEGVSEDVDWEVKHDTANVMNVVGIWHSINDNKKLIEKLVVEMDQRLSAGKKALKESGIMPISDETSEEAIYKLLIAY